MLVVLHLTAVKHQTWDWAWRNVIVEQHGIIC